MKDEMVFEYAVMNTIGRLIPLYRLECIYEFLFINRIHTLPKHDGRADHIGR
jgi:hypothetical protein